MHRCCHHTAAPPPTKLPFGLTSRGISPLQNLISCPNMSFDIYSDSDLSDLPPSSSSVARHYLPASLVISRGMCRDARLLAWLGTRHISTPLSTREDIWNVFEKLKTTTSWLRIPHKCGDTGFFVCWVVGTRHVLWDTEGVSSMFQLDEEGLFDSCFHVDWLASLWKLKDFLVV